MFFLRRYLLTFLLNSRLCDCYEVLSKTAVHSAKTGEDFGENSGSKSARITKLWQFWQGHQKVQSGTKGNRQKNSPRLKGLKAIWRKWHYLPISMHLKCKDWKRFWRKKRLQRVPEWPSYNNFRKVTQNPHFLKKCKGETKGNFSKNRPKSSHRLKGLKALWRKWHYPPISMLLKLSLIHI